jgi:hypothetical protein
MVLNVFSTVQEAMEILGDGELLRAVAHAFNPSPDYSPQAIRAMVVNGNTQASRVLKSGENTILNLKSSIYGVPANQLKMQLSAGTNPGTKKVVFTLKDQTEKLDNIGKKSISVQYTGAGSAATITIDNDKLAVSVTGADDSITVSFEDFPTVEEVVGRLNDTGVFAAVQLEMESNIPANELDAVSAIDVKTAAVNLKSDFYALYHALENSYYVGKENVEKENGAANTMPDEDADPVYFDGASAGTYTVEDWNKALSALEAENVQILSTP